MAYFTGPRRTRPTRNTVGLEVGARRVGERRRPLVAVKFPVFIETPHKKGDPAAVAFEKGDAHLAWRSTAAAAKAADGEHLFDGMGKSVAQHEIVAELFTDLARRRGVRLVKAQGHAEIFERDHSGS